MDNPFKPGTQLFRLFEALEKGPVTNREIITDLNIFKYTGRLSEIRQAGFEVAARKLNGGLWQYKLIME